MEKETYMLEKKEKKKKDNAIVWVYEVSLILLLLFFLFTSFFFFFSDTKRMYIFVWANLFPLCFVRFFALVNLIFFNFF